MSDIKHIEYCIKLGNTQLQDKLQQSNQYIELKNSDAVKQENISFRQRIQNWK